MKAHTRGMAWAVPGGDLRRQLALAVQPSLHALALPKAHVRLCQGQPTPLVGGGMKRHVGHEASSRLRRPRFIPARALMSMQSILAHTTLSGVRIRGLPQFPPAAGRVLAGPPGGDAPVPPATLGLTQPTLRAPPLRSYASSIRAGLPGLGRGVGRPSPHKWWHASSKQSTG